MATDRANYTPEELIRDAVESASEAEPEGAQYLRAETVAAITKRVLVVLPEHDRRLLLALANEIELNDYWEIEQAVGHIRFRAAGPSDEIIETDRWGL